MNINVASGTNAPEQTHVLMGLFQSVNGQEKQVYVDVASIEDPAKKAVYDAFFELTGPNNFATVINAPYSADFNRVIPQEVILANVVIDYATLAPAEKAIVDNAFVLLNAIPDLEV